MASTVLCALAAAFATVGVVSLVLFLFGQGG